MLAFSTVKFPVPETRFAQPSMFAFCAKSFLNAFHVPGSGSLRHPERGYRLWLRVGQPQPEVFLRIYARFKTLFRCERRSSERLQRTAAIAIPPPFGAKARSQMELLSRDRYAI